jgi:hypothetical protein
MDSCLGNSTGLAANLPFGSLRSGCIGAIEGINWTLIIGVAGCLLRMKSIGIGTSGTAATRTSSNRGNGTYGRLYVELA